MRPATDAPGQIPSSARTDFRAPGLTGSHMPPPDGPEMRLLVAPDSFKGSLSATRVCEIVTDAVRLADPSAEVVSVPLADGGEGTVDAFLVGAGGRPVDVTVTGPWGERVRARYGVLADGAAVIEMAAAAGLPLVGRRLDPGRTTTYGVGELIVHAARAGAPRIVVGLGGSATNDGGTGAAAAAGIRFLDARGRPFVPVGDSLAEIAHLDPARAASALKGVEIITMCDVDNPLCGPRGAAAVYGPQKGATPDHVARLDAGLAHLAALIQQELGVDVRHLPGAGAAGGMGAGMVAFFGSTLRSGIETVLDTVAFDRKLAGADWVITGEGNFDAQTFQGKAVSGIARHAQRAGVPVIVVAGRVDPAAAKVAPMHGIHRVVAASPAGASPELRLAAAEQHLRAAIAQLVPQLATGR